jgi:D-sedoheptulose 7-phosphate isomerase
MTLDVDLRDHIDCLLETVRKSSETILDVVSRLEKCFGGGGKLLICGNGGSAADAQHLAAEFMNRMRVDREPWPAIALTTDSSVLTSISNDGEYNDVFARQVHALGQAGDVLIALSTSGGSETVLRALRVAKQRSMVTIGFSGLGGVERMGPDCDVLVAVPSRDTPRIQECHEFLYHVIAELVEQKMLDASGSAAANMEGKRP